MKLRLWDSDNKMFDFLDFDDLEKAESVLNSYWNYFYSDYFKHNPSFIQQCVGMKDKNDKDIYVGDILIKRDYNALGWGRERTCEVRPLEDGYFTIITTLGDGYAISDFDSEQLEIIGNIFENSELLNPENEQL